MRDSQWNNDHHSLQISHTWCLGTTFHTLALKFWCRGHQPCNISFTVLASSTFSKKPEVWSSIIPLPLDNEAASDQHFTHYSYTQHQSVSFIPLFTKISLVRNFSQVANPTKRNNNLIWDSYLPNSLQGKSKQPAPLKTSKNEWAQTFLPKLQTSCPPHLFGWGLNREFGENEQPYWAPNHKQLTWQLYDCFNNVRNNNIQKGPTFIEFERNQFIDSFQNQKFLVWDKLSLFFYPFSFCYMNTTLRFI